jgi:hypothetical protein
MCVMVRVWGRDAVRTCADLTTRWAGGVAMFTPPILARTGDGGVGIASFGVIVRAKHHGTAVAIQWDLCIQRDKDTVRINRVLPFNQ